MTRPKTRTLLVLLACLALLTSGCTDGGGDGNPDGSPRPTATGARPDGEGGEGSVLRGRATSGGEPIADADVIAVARSVEGALWQTLGRQVPAAEDLPKVSFRASTTDLRRVRASRGDVADGEYELVVPDQSDSYLVCIGNVDVESASRPFVDVSGCGRIDVDGDTRVDLAVTSAGLRLRRR